MKKYLRKTNGITLVALVITIIILLILSGVAIGILTQTGLFENAKRAKEKTIEKQQEEDKILKSYEEGIESNGYIVSDRSEPWNGATMLTINISNVTGGTFTINVNNIEANNYGKLYYYINNKLVYSGTESSYKVTEFDGQPITNNTVYKVKVLSEPFEISVTTGEGDNVSTWLACIGNSNKEGYTINNLTELFNNETLMDDLLTNESAIEYLAKSTEYILPEFINIVCSNGKTFQKICNNSKAFSKLLEQQKFRESMYDNYEITQEVLANSDSALNTIKNSSQYVKTTCSSYTRVSSPSQVVDTIYSGKAILLDLTVTYDSNILTIGNFLDGTANYSLTGEYAGRGTVTYKLNKYMKDIKGAKYSCDNNPSAVYGYLKI